MDRAKPPRPDEAKPSSPAEPGATQEKDDRTHEPNPPYTTTDGITAPKFGSAGSGGAEIEPGPERD